MFLLLLFSFVFGQCHDELFDRHYERDVLSRVMKIDKINKISYFESETTGRL